MRTRTRKSTPRWSRPARRTLAVIGGTALLAAPVVALAATPTAQTAPSDASELTDTYALISGVVNPKGTATSYFFQWGPTTDYGQSTPVTSAGNGTVDVPVDVSLDGLAPSTAYHFRIVAQPSTPKDPNNPAAEYVYGADQTLTTAPSLAAFIIGGKTPVQAKRAQVKVQCDGPVDETCDGRLRLRGKVGGKPTNLGSTGFHVPVGTTKVVKVYLTPAARQAIKASKTRHLLADATAKLAGSKAAGTNKLILAG
jgi:hypothetical protein